MVPSIKLLPDQPTVRPRRSLCALQRRAHHRRHQPAQPQGLVRERRHVPGHRGGWRGTATKHNGSCGVDWTEWAAVRSGELTDPPALAVSLCAAPAPTSTADAGTTGSARHSARRAREPRAAEYSLAGVLLRTIQSARTSVRDANWLRTEAGTPRRSRDPRRQPTTPPPRRPRTRRTTGAVGHRPGARETAPSRRPDSCQPCGARNRRQRWPPGHPKGSALTPARRTPGSVDNSAQLILPGFGEREPASTTRTATRRRTVSLRAVQSRRAC
jgi:hypothetical protein